MIEFRFLLFQEVFESRVFFNPHLFYLFGLHPDVIDFPFMLSCELMVCPYLAQLEESMFFDKPSIFLELSLAILKSHEFMFGLYLSVLLQFLFYFLNFLGEFPCLVHFGAHQYVILPGSK